MKPKIAVSFIVSNSKYLLIRRSSAYLTGNWQMVTGKIEEGETAWQAALREIHEETGLKPDRLYSSDCLESFYEKTNDIIYHNPIFVAFLDQHPNEVTLNPREHDAYDWLSYEDTLKRLEFQAQKQALEYIEVHFVQNPPNPFFLI